MYVFNILVDVCMHCVHFRWYPKEMTSLWLPVWLKVTFSNMIHRKSNIDAYFAFAFAVYESITPICALHLEMNTRLALCHFDLMWNLMQGGADVERPVRLWDVFHRKLLCVETACHRLHFQTKIQLKSTVKHWFATSKYDLRMFVSLFVTLHGSIRSISLYRVFYIVHDAK